MAIMIRHIVTNANRFEVHALLIVIASLGLTVALPRTVSKTRTATMRELIYIINKSSTSILIYEPYPPTMTTATIKTRRAFRWTDHYTPGTPKLKYVEEALPPLGLTSVLIKIHAISLNYRDVNIANGGNPWPVLPNGILCNDAAGELVATGEEVKSLAVGDKVVPIIDTKYITGRELGRSWLDADEDGVMADHVILDEEIVVKLPD